MKLTTLGILFDLCKKRYQQGYFMGPQNDFLWHKKEIIFNKKLNGMERIGWQNSLTPCRTNLLMWIIQNRRSRYNYIKIEAVDLNQVLVLLVLTINWYSSWFGFFSGYTPLFSMEYFNT